ncbi:MAG: hypothetical protein FJ011_18800 [Chloroflexi bacterium]|nr:hypothetical protein [Chloroflexota bacterium]
MTIYVRCLKNRILFGDDAAGNFAPHLISGRVYKVVPPEKNDRDMLRVIDGSGEDYLYPKNYFEPFVSDSTAASESVTVHLDPYLKGILHAEAIAARKSISALLRDWIDERLDLPAAA